MEEPTATLRLYVGGLGERVTQEDINKTFCNLGVVQSVDIIRTKGRSFAYINFLPSSHNSLAKLFSTYNGCAWKGGKLKLEKAKEHYLDRLKREWSEEAEFKNNEHINQGDADVSIVDSPDALNLKDVEFRLFFPKLRKVKPLPLSGTGKHKYSFRRLEAPPVPVHFCDCPEHSVPVQTRAVTHANVTCIKKVGINKKEYNMMSSVKNRFVRQETSSDHKKAVVHDSIIQDDGLNEEEINMMDSVMKKLLDRGTSKKDQENLRFSQKKTALNSEIQEITIDIDDEIEDDDDDDIKINAISVENFSSFSSRSWERPENLQNEETDEIDDETDDDDIQINAVYGRNERQTSLANKITRLNGRTGSSILKRKSVSIGTNTNDMTSPINEKKGLLNIPSKKPAWKQLVGDSSSSSFTLSQITPENDTNLEKQRKLDKKASSDNKKSKKVRFVLPEEPTPSDEPPAGSEEHEKDNSGVLRNSQLSQHNKKSKKICEDVPDEPKPSDELPAGGEEHDVANNFVEMGLSAQHDEISNVVEKVASEKPKLSDEIPAGSEEHDVANNFAPRDSTPSQRNKKRKKARNVASAEPKPGDEPPAGSEEHEVANKFVKTDQSAQDEKDRPPVTRGSSWLQKSSWTQLTGGGNDSSFSICQILPGDLVQKQNFQKSDDFSTVSFISAGGAFSKDQRTSEMMSDGSTRKDAQLASVPRDMEVSKASEGTVLSNSGTKTIFDSRTKPASSYSIRGVQLSESCPFMRNADSMKEWKTAKTSMSNSLKKMKKN